MLVTYIFFPFLLVTETKTHSLQHEVYPHWPLETLTLPKVYPGAPLIPLNLEVVVHIYLSIHTLSLLTKVLCVLCCQLHQISSNVSRSYVLENFHMPLLHQMPSAWRRFRDVRHCRRHFARMMRLYRVQMGFLVLLHLILHHSHREVDHPYDECPLKRLMPFLRPPSRMCSQMMLWEPLCVVFLQMILADSNIVSLSAGYKRKERQIPSGSLPFVTCDTVITVTCVLSHLLVLYLSVLGITSRYLCPVATFHGCAFLFQESWQKRWHK